MSGHTGEQREEKKWSTMTKLSLVAVVNKEPVDDHWWMILEEKGRGRERRGSFRELRARKRERGR